MPGGEKLTPEQLGERGNALLATWGARTTGKIADLIDTKVYEQQFAASAGPKAKAELSRLRAPPEVKRYLAMDRSIRQAKILDFTVEQLDRYVLIKRIKLGSVSPLETANTKLMDANPTEAAEAALKKLEKSTRSKELRRFLALNDKSSGAMAAAIRKDEIVRMSPAMFFAGVEADLAEMCIGLKQ